MLPEDCFNRKNGWWLKKNLEKLMKSWVKLEDVFLIRRGEKKICAGEFDFCRGEFAMTTVHPFSFFHREKLNKYENSCHLLHGCCNRLNINTLPCNVLVFACHWCHSVEKWHQWHGIFACHCTVNCWKSMNCNGCAMSDMSFRTLNQNLFPWIWFIWILLYVIVSLP